MEYIIMISIAIVVFIFLYLIIKVEKIRNIANAMFLEAEKSIEKNKFDYVCNNLYYHMPSIFKTIVNINFFRNIVQMIYDKSRRIAKDLLDDGKYNKSVKWVEKSIKML